MIEAPASPAHAPARFARGGNQETFFAPMDRDYDVMDVFAEVLNLPDKAIHVERGDSPLVSAAKR